MLLLILSACLVIALDQLTKRVVVAKLAPGQILWSRKYFRVSRVDSASMMGVLHNRWAGLFLWLGVAVCLVLLVRQGYFFERNSAKIAIGAALAGSGSNLYDHFRCGAVIDFLDIAGWPVFNLADAAITTGALLSVWLMR